MAVPVNRTIFLDALFGNEEGEAQNASLPFRTVCETPLLTSSDECRECAQDQIADHNKVPWTLHLNPGKYTIPSYLNFPVVIQGSGYETTLIRFIGFTEPQQTTVTIKDVTILDDGPIILLSDFEFERCKILSPISLMGGKAKFDDCIFESEYLRSYQSEIPADPFILPMEITNSYLEINGEIQGVLIRNSRISEINHTGAGHGVLFSTFDNVIITTYNSAGEQAFYGSLLKNCSINRLEIAEGAFLTCDLSSTDIDFIAGQGPVFSASNVLNCNFLGIQTVKDIFIDCFNLNNIYVQFLVEISDGYFIHQTQQTLTATNIKCDMAVQISEGGFLINEGASVDIDGVLLRNLILENAYFAFGDEGNLSINNLVIHNASLLTDNPVNFFQANGAGTESIVATITNVNVLGLSILPNESEEAPEFNFAKINSESNTQHMVLDNIVINDLAGNIVSILRVDTPGAYLKATNINLMSVVVAEFVFVYAEQGTIEESYTSLTNAEITDDLTENRQKLWKSMCDKYMERRLRFGPGKIVEFKPLQGVTKYELRARRRKSPSIMSLASRGGKIYSKFKKIKNIISKGFSIAKMFGFFLRQTAEKKRVGQSTGTYGEISDYEISNVTVNGSVNEDDALFESNDGAFLVTTDMGVQEGVFTSPASLDVFFADADGQISSTTSTFSNINLSGTADTTRIFEALDGGVITTEHNSFRDLETPVDQAITVGTDSDVELRFLYVESDAPANSVGQPSVSVFVDWQGMTPA